MKAYAALFILAPPYLDCSASPLSLSWPDLPVALVRLARLCHGIVPEPPAGA